MNTCFGLVCVFECVILINIMFKKAELDAYLNSLHESMAVEIDISTTEDFRIHGVRI